MKPVLTIDDDGAYWGDADSPVSDDPDDGFIGIDDSEVFVYIENLRATIEAKDAEIGRLKMRIQQLRAIFDDAAEGGW